MYYAKIKTVTEEEIKRILAEHYTKHWGGTLEENLDRPLHKFVEENPNLDGASIYLLKGSPPKGYAIYTSYKLWFFNLSGRRFASWGNVKVEGI